MNFNFSYLTLSLVAPCIVLNITWLAFLVEGVLARNFDIWVWSVFGYEERGTHLLWPHRIYKFNAWAMPIANIAMVVYLYRKV